MILGIVETWMDKVCRTHLTVRPPTHPPTWWAPGVGEGECNVNLYTVCGAAQRRIWH